MLLSAYVVSQLMFVSPYFGGRRVCLAYFGGRRVFVQLKKSFGFRIRSGSDERPAGPDCFSMDPHLLMPGVIYVERRSKSFQHLHSTSQPGLRYPTYCTRSDQSD